MPIAESKLRTPISQRAGLEYRFSSVPSKGHTLRPRLVFGSRKLSGRRSRRTEEIAAEKKPGIGDGLLDMLQGGPKLRRWYGEEDLIGVGGARKSEVDDEEGRQPEQQLDAEKDVVLVLDADSPMGEQVILQLILLREKVRVLVADPGAAKQAFGPYVEAAQGRASALARNRAALAGVRTLVVPGRTGGCLQAAAAAGVQHVVLLSAAGASAQGFDPLRALGLGEQGALADASREEEARTCGVPYTVVRVGGVRDAPAGASQVAVMPDKAPGKSVSREGLAQVLAECARLAPGEGWALTVEEAGQAGPEPWRDALRRMAPAPVEAQP